ncbi:MAG: hypothetical protein K0S80_3069 [Neobacillus sp.]|nr:hypothetical protein [Neobacillus sp.]
MSKTCSCCLTTTGNIKEYTEIGRLERRDYLCDDCYLHVNGWTKADFGE